MSGRGRQDHPRDDAKHNSISGKWSVRKLFTAGGQNAGSDITQTANDIADSAVR